MTLFALGPFRISLDTMALQELEDDEQVNTASTARHRAMNSKHWLSAGDRNIRLNALIYKEAVSPGGPLQIELMRLWMRSGQRAPLISMSGHFYGFYTLEGIKVVKTHALPNGTFQKMDLTLTLGRAPLGISLFGVALA